MRLQAVLAVGLALGLVAVTGGRASADGPPPFDDIDGLFTCVGRTSSVQDDLTVSFSSTGPHYADRTVLRLSVLDIHQPPNALVDVRVDDDTVVLPDGWWSEANGWSSPEQVDYWEVTRSITGLAAGTGEGSLTWGLSIDGGPMEPYTVAMVAEVAPCAPLVPRPSPPATSTADGRLDRGPALPVVLLPVVAIAALVAAGRPARRRR